MKEFSPQQLRSQAHHLVESWVALHNSTEDEHTWEKHFPIVNSILEEVGSRGQLDPLLGVIFDETLEHHVEHLELDEETDISGAFHDFIMTHLTSSMKVVEHDGETTVNTVQIGGIPLFGHFDSLNEVVRDEQFGRMLMESGIVPPSSQLAMLGMAPIGVAQMHLLEAQHLHDTVRELQKLFENPHEGVEDDFERIAHEWNLDFSPPATNSAVVSGFVAVFAYSTDSAIEEDTPNLHNNSEEQVEQWENLKNQWFAQHRLKDVLQREHIGAPHPLREAIAVAMADFALQNMFLQHSVGGDDAEIARVDVVAPWSEAEENDDSHMVHVTDQTTVYGFTKDERMMGSVGFNAMAMAMVFSEIAQCWESWIEVQPTFFTKDAHRSEHPQVRRVLH